MHNTGITALTQARLFRNNKVFEYEEASVSSRTTASMTAKIVIGCNYGFIFLRSFIWRYHK
jgi:hypothetical protein